MDDKLVAKALMTFDHTYEPQIQMYDHLPYQRDIDVCNWKKPRIVSGNIVKYFQYDLGKPQIIQNDFVVEVEEPELIEELEDDASDDSMDPGELLVSMEDDIDEEPIEDAAEEPEEVLETEIAS